VLRLLRALSGEAGCLLVLEDLHWADRETLALLEYLADNSAAERVLCVGTLRDEEGDAAAGLASVLEARGSAVVLPLVRLDAAAADRMALACVGASARGTGRPQTAPRGARPRNPGGTGGRWR
jgi:predicted ATPase